MAHLPRPPHLAPPHDGVVSGLFLKKNRKKTFFYSDINKKTEKRIDMNPQ
jgi:hypothetical protein